MADQTAIEWCDSTFNPWIGCTRVSPACDHCYAAVSTPARTMGIGWGAGQPRRRTSPANWKLPLRWNAQQFWQCSVCGLRTDRPMRAQCISRDDALRTTHRWVPARRRVFCASLADVFDNEVDPTWRRDLFELILRTPNLDWLLLTKRIGNVLPMVEALKLEHARYHAEWALFDDWLSGRPPANVWIGATICNQTEAGRDIPKLLKVPAAVRFLSIEPMLGRVDLCEHLGMWWNQTMGAFEGVGSRINVMPNGQPRIGWVIAGGESGTEARPMHPGWVRSLRDQCAAAHVPFLFKQWGEWVSVSEVAGPGEHYHFEDGATVRRTGKKLAGRTLDGVQHTAFPEVR